MANGNGVLNAKQHRFVEEYLKDLNATQAYSRVYGATGKAAEANGCRLIGNDKVAAAVAKAAAERSKAAGVTVERVLKELVRMAWVDIAGAFNSNGTLLPIHDIPEDVRRAIVSIETDEIWETDDRDRRVLVGYTRKVKFADKRGSNELLGKYLKMFVERHEWGLTDDLLELLQKGEQRANNGR